MTEGTREGLRIGGILCLAAVLAVLLAVGVAYA